MSAHIAIDRYRMAAFCRRHRIRKLSPFGSVLRVDFRQSVLDSAEVQYVQ